MTMARPPFTHLFGEKLVVAPIFGLEMVAFIGVTEPDC